jgi:small subunit ribosomal protein S16
MGPKHGAYYRVVVSESRSTPQSRFVEVLGTYDPSCNPAALKLDVERAEGWIRKGATPSETVRSLLARARTVQA